MSSTFRDIGPDNSPKWKPVKTYSRKMRLLEQQLNRPLVRRLSRSKSAGNAFEVSKQSPNSPISIRKVSRSKSHELAGLISSHDKQPTGDEDKSHGLKEGRNGEGSPMQFQVPELHKKGGSGGTKDNGDAIMATPSRPLGHHPAASSKKTTPQISTGKKLPRRQFLVFDKTPVRGYKIQQRITGSNMKRTISKCTPGDGFSDDEASPVGLFLSVKKKKPIIGSPGMGVLDLTQSVSSPVSTSSPMVAAPQAKKVRKTVYDNSFLPDAEDFVNPIDQYLPIQLPSGADDGVPSENHKREPSPELGEVMHAYSEDKARPVPIQEQSLSHDDEFSSEQVPDSEYSSEVDDSQPEEIGSGDNVTDKGSLSSARVKTPKTKPAREATTGLSSSIPETVDNQDTRNDLPAQIDNPPAEWERSSHEDGSLDVLPGCDNIPLKSSGRGLLRSSRSPREGLWAPGFGLLGENPMCDIGKKLDDWFENGPPPMSEALQRLDTYFEECDKREAHSQGEAARTSVWCQNQKQRMKTG